MKKVILTFLELNFSNINNNDCRGIRNHKIYGFRRIKSRKMCRCNGCSTLILQRIYDDARRKIADNLVNDKTLKIEGGDYKLCSEFKDKEIVMAVFAADIGMEGM